MDKTTRLERSGKAISEKDIDVIAMHDTAKNSHIALPLIFGFETLLIGFWIVNHFEGYYETGLEYLLGYVSLLMVSGGVYYFLHKYEEHVEKMCELVKLIQNVYVVFLLVWSLYFTYLDSTQFDAFSPLIFITIACIAPAFSYMDPKMWAMLLVPSGMAMYGLGYVYNPNFANFAVNFAVFLIISCFAQIAFYDLRRNSYIRQIELKELADENYEFAYRDSLTGLLNRHSYSETVEILQHSSVPDNLVVLSFDANDLKGTNDTLGHRVGDELLAGAAMCVKESFGRYGSIFRTGGDEFFGIVTLTKEQLEEALHDFERLTKEWKGKTLKELSISIGFACKIDYPDATIDTLFIEAENAMYADKANYYKVSGKDRRH